MMMMMMTWCVVLLFITQGGEGRGKTNKKRKATKSKGRGLEEGASLQEMQRKRVAGGPQGGLVARSCAR